jgi:hypothetical protein
VSAGVGGAVDDEDDDGCAAKRRPLPRERSRGRKVAEWGSG